MIALKLPLLLLPILIAGTTANEEIIPLPSPAQANFYCSELLKDVCNDCTFPDHLRTDSPTTHGTFACPDGTSFFENQRELDCILEYKYSNYTGLTTTVRQANGTEYEGKLECHEYGRAAITPEEKERCTAACDATAECKLYKDEEILCACQPGYSDISTETNQPRGSECKKCDQMRDIDFVIVYDQSGSVQKRQSVFIRFMDDLINFISDAEGDNRIALVRFGTDAYVRMPLTDSKEEFKKFMADPRLEDGEEETNTAKGLYIANREVYAKYPADTSRRRVTILITDGAPSQCNHIRTNDQVIIAPELNKTIGEISVFECMEAELKAASKEMTEQHKAEIFVVALGELEEHDMQFLKYVQADDDKYIYAAKFEELRTQALPKLQKQFC